MVQSSLKAVVYIEKFENNITLQFLEGLCMMSWRMLILKHLNAGEEFVDKKEEEAQLELLLPW